MPVPTINPLPQAPSRSDGPVAFNALADPFIAALPPFVLQANALALAINNALISIASSVDAAAGSASAAATSANAANSSKNAAAQQVGLAADQVALANSAKNEAQAAAVAAGGNLPQGREPFTSLQINDKGAVSWGVALPDRAQALGGQTLMLDADRIPKWGYASQQIGDILTTARTPAIDFSAAQGVLPANINWASVTYGKGIFVAIATTSNIAATSTDGITWTQRTLPVSATWYAVAYGNGVFVAVGSGITIAATSLDGITWTQRTLPVSASWRAITYANGVFVAVAQASSIAATSPDGITWTQRTLPVSATWNSVVYGNGVFLLTASSGSVAATSPDGITWTQRTLPAAYALRGTAFGNGVFVAPINGTINAITSPDGITWTIRTMPAARSWSAITYGNGLFVAVASGSGGATTSPDGITWVSSNLLTTSPWVSIAYGGGTYASISSNSTVASALVQGSGYLPANGGIYLQSAYPQLFAQIGLIGGQRATAFVAKSATPPFGPMAYGENGVVLAISNTAGTLGNVYKSTDYGLTFALVATATTANITSQILYLGSGKWMFGYSATSVAISSDEGATFTPTTLPSSFVRAETDGNGTIICVCSSNVVKSINYGTSFTGLAFSTANMFCYAGAGRWVATIGSNYTSAYVSNDAFETYSVKEFNGTITSYSVSISADRVSGTIVIVSGYAGSSNMAVSFDRGETFSVKGSGNGYAPTDCIYAGSDTWLVLARNSSSVYDIRKSSDGAKTFVPGPSVNIPNSPIQIIADPNKGYVIANSRVAGAGSYSVSSPVLGYDGATQFKVPALTKQEGANPYIKAV